MVLLSIIVPFYNSENKCEALLKTLAGCDRKYVEVICVDDGSQDGTMRLLAAFEKSAACSVTVLRQDNRGPGGARNAGFEASSGEYIWFVDSDDDICLDVALGFLIALQGKGYDAIDFNFFSRGVVVNTTLLPAGEYIQGDATDVLLNKFGTIRSKIFRRSVFDDTGLRYPEYCIFEDIPLESILPFLIKTLYKSNIVSYIHHEEHESVTRGKRTDKYFDRMLTAVWGYRTGRALSQDSGAHLDALKYHFVRLYLNNTIWLTRWPSRAWIEKARVMKKFRGDALGLDLEVNVFSLINSQGFSRVHRIRWLAIWMFSYWLPSQDEFFRKKRLSAWGKPFVGPQTPVRFL